MADWRQLELEVQGRSYRVRLLRRSVADSAAPRLVVVSYLPNDLAARLLRVCLRSVRAFTPEPHELWVVDNNSPSEHLDWLCADEGINLILNRTTPRLQPSGLLDKLGLRRTPHLKQMEIGSYANAVGLELAARAMDSHARYFFAMHSDVLVCRTGWLGFLLAKLDDRTRGAAVLHDRIRVQAMHVCGMLFDFRLFQRLSMDFLPKLPEYDVGDLVTIRLRQAGYNYYVCRNSYNQPESVEQIPAENPLRRIYCVRVFDDDDNIIYLHLARGTRKATGHQRDPAKTLPEDWIAYAEEHLLKDPSR